MSLHFSAGQIDFLKRRKIEINCARSGVILPEAPNPLEARSQHPPGGFMPLGAYSYSHSYCPEILRIGRYCSIGDNLRVFGNTHPTDRASTSPVFYSPRRYGKWGGDRAKRECLKPFEVALPGVTIGNDVWIGSNVSLKSGITVGDGAIIAYGAVVTKDAPPFSIVAGTPGQKIAPRFEDVGLAQAFALLRWWRFEVSDLIDLTPERPTAFANALEKAITQGTIKELPEERLLIRKLMRSYRPNEFEK